MRGFVLSFPFTYILSLPPAADRQRGRKQRCIFFKSRGLIFYLLHGAIIGFIQAMGIKTTKDHSNRHRNNEITTPQTIMLSLGYIRMAIISFIFTSIVKEQFPPSLIYYLFLFPLSRDFLFVVKEPFYTSYRLPYPLLILHKGNPYKSFTILTKTSSWGYSNICLL